MNHLIILTLVLNLVAGTAVSLNTLASYRRFRRPFLKTLLAYVLSFNGLVIVYLGYSYVLTNVFRNDMSKVPEYPAVFALLLFLVFSAEFGMTVNVFRLVRHLKGREVSGAAKGLFALWAAAFGAASAWGFLRFYQDPQTQTFYRVHAAWMASVILIILAVLVTGLAGPGGKGRAGNSLRPFAWIFLAAYGAFAFSSLDFYLLHTGLQKYYDPVVLLGINLCPLLWLKVFFEKASPAPATAEFDAAKLDRFCEKHGISKRERDIIEQVMNGGSNRDIEKALFISGNTVKNHLYNVFQKAGVKSRSQLIHRVLHFEG